MQYKSYNFVENQWYYPSVELPVLVGNTDDKINWASIIDSLKDKEGVKSRIQKYLSDDIQTDMRKMFEDSKYCLFSAKWTNYYPGKDFDQSVSDSFGEIVKKSKCVKSWISRVDPGKTAPWHWDIDDNEKEYLSQGDVVRFTCKINPFDPGHITAVGNGVLPKGNVGDIYQWVDHRQWHGSANAGLIPKYQFNYIAWI
jgi:hypothetical protein